MHKPLKYSFIPVVISLLISGCEGEMGKDGIDLLPDDIRAPNVELILPQASRPIYNRLIFEAYASDDVAVAGVEFLIDGNVPESGELTMTEPPWQIGWDCDHLSNGLHYFQARTWDEAGHDGLSTVVIVKKTDPPQGFTIDTLRSYIEIMEKDQIPWTLPDMLGEFTGYGARFIPHSPCKITRFGIRVYVSSNWQGTRPLSFEIRTSVNNLPASLIYSDTV